MGDPHDFDPNPQPLDTISWTPPRFLRRHAERSARRRRNRRLVLAAVLGAFALAFLFTDGGLLSIWVRRVRVQRLERKVAALEARQKWLQAEVERRRSDPETLERIAREQYGMVREGEKLIRILEVSEEEARQAEKAQEEMRKRAESEAQAERLPQEARRSSPRPHP